MRAVDIIQSKRDGARHSAEELEFLISGYVKEEIPDYQVASWLMAVYFQGMNAEETSILTDLMIRSGESIDLSDLEGPLVDKHSTGGVGDKVSLILAPVAASCGLQVPMMSGRALGHTGGTLDKLDSIPGFQTELDSKRFREIIQEVGFAMTGQSKKIVPADRLLYALRDVTATVESIPLITSSILSKKFAEGSSAFVFDVKCGSGAFMKDRESAEKLARSLIQTGKKLDREVIAVLSDMSQPLGNKVGNFLEVEESVQALRGEGPQDLMEVVYRLGSWMLIAGGLETDREKAEERCRETVSDGKAFEKFLKNVELQGGDKDALLEGIGKRRATIQEEIKAETEGLITGLDAYKIGMAGVYLGAGRNKASDKVLADVGIDLHKKRGDRVEKGEILCTIYAEEKNALEEGKKFVISAYNIDSSENAAKKVKGFGGNILQELSDL